MAGATRLLIPVSFSLADALAQRVPDWPEIGAADGVRVLSAPTGLIPHIRAQYSALLCGAEQRYRRAFIAMDGDFDAYLAGFSGKTRSTLRRKQRKLEQASGGALDLRAYRTPAELAAFFALAQPLARRTYQARRLDAALPEDAAWQAEQLRLAANDRVRAFALCLNGAPIAYLYLPVEGGTLIYAYLGHDPDFAALSPGTVLQLAALERLFAERRFACFDFTEGEGPHKTLFATGAVDCASFCLLRPTAGNRLLLASLAMFDRGVALARSAADRVGLAARARQLLR